VLFAILVRSALRSASDSGARTNEGGPTIWRYEVCRAVCSANGPDSMSSPQSRERADSTSSSPWVSADRTICRLVHWHIGPAAVAPRTDHAVMRVPEWDEPEWLLAASSRPTMGSCAVRRPATVTSSDATRHPAAARVDHDSPGPDEGTSVRGYPDQASHAPPHKRRPKS
jgi:hypothetical protein